LGGTRQQLPEKRPQQARLAIEQSGSGLRVAPPPGKRQGAPLRVGDAARPALRIAGMALREAAAFVPHARGRLARGRAGPKKIRAKLLKFLGIALGMQQKAANGRRIGDFRHRGGSKATSALGYGSLFVLVNTPAQISQRDRETARVTVAMQKRHGRA